MRTFAHAGLVGGIAALLGTAVLAVAVAFAGAAAIAGYLRDTREDPGLTTEAALVLCVLLGALAVREPALAAALGVGVTILLASRSRLHRLTRDTLTEQELHDGLLLAAAALIVLPLLPDRSFGPGGVLNPTAVWRLVVVMMAINGIGYVALRVLGPRRALPLAGFVGGFVSGAATVGAMGARARADQRVRRPAVAGAVAATVATVLLTALVAGAISGDALRALAPVLLLSGAAALAATAVAALGATAPDGPAELELGRAFDLKAPVALALILSAVLVAADILTDALGDAGVSIAAAAAGFADAQAAAVLAAAWGGWLLL